MRLTASALSRAEQCIGSIVLPGFDESGEYAATGSAVDHFVQMAKTRGKALALREAPEKLRAYLDALTMERIPDGAEYQVGFALNAVTGEARRIVSRGAGYPELGEEWILGTADIVGVRNGRGLVWDLKWGNHTIGRDPADDLQLGLYGVCVRKVAGVDEVEVGFVRAGWDSVLRPEVAMLDEMALDALEERIRAIWRRAQAARRNGGPAHLHPGDWCGYCPVRRNCPAMIQPTALMLRGDLEALAATEPMPIEMVREKITALTPEQRGRVFELCDEIAERAKLVRQVIRDDARQAPIPLSGGRELRLVQWGTRQASPEAEAREEALEAELRAAGEVLTIKVDQVRVMKARR